MRINLEPKFNIGAQDELEEVGTPLNIRNVFGALTNQDLCPNIDNRCILYIVPKIGNWDQDH